MRMGIALRMAVILAALAAQVPALAATFSESPGIPTAASPASTGQYGYVTLSAVVDVSNLPAPSPTTHPNVVKPFLVRDSAALATEKQGAEVGTLAARPTLKVVTANKTQAVASTQSEQMITNFPVMDLTTQYTQIGQDQGLEPPDTQLAAGPDYLVEMVNASGSVWTKSGSRVLKFDLNSFFPVPSGYSFTDPRILYDAPSGRWFASGLSFAGSGASQNDSQVYVAVSATSDPTGSWSTYVVAQNTQHILYDQPKIGVSDDKIVISANDFTGQSPSYSGVQTWVLQKSDLLAGSQSIAIWDSGLDASKFNLVPSQSLSPTTAEYVVYNASGSVGVIAITGTPAQQTVVMNSPTLLAISPTSAPPPAAQPGTGTIDTGDDRFLSAVWQNGILWTGGNDACQPTGDTQNRSCLRLDQVSTAGASPALLQDFDVGVSQAYLYYPAVSLDGDGNAFFSFSESSSTQYASTATTALTASAPYTALGSILIVQAGIGSYGGSRWGDYSAAATDPTNPLYVWVTAEYAEDTNSYWGTGTAEVTLSPPDTPTSTPIITDTPTATDTPTVTSTSTITLTATDTPTNTATPTSTNTPTATITPTATPIRIFLPIVVNG
jgi:hypothetical protein